MGSCKANICKVRTSVDDVSCGYLIEKVFSQDNTILVTDEDIGSGIHKLNLRLNASSLPYVQSVSGQSNVVDNTDPLNPIILITNADIAHWNAAVYTEVDPVFVAFRNARVLQNGASQTVLNWATPALMHTNGNTALNWSTQTAKDSTNVLAYNLSSGNRLYYDASGVVRMDLTGAGCQLYNQSHDVSCAWDSDTVQFYNPNNGINTFYMDSQIVTFRDPDNNNVIFSFSSAVSTSALNSTNPTNSDSMDFVNGFKFNGKWSFNNQAPSLTQTGWTITNPTTNRSLDVASATLGDLRQFVGTLAQDLITKGVISA